MNSNTCSDLIIINVLDKKHFEDCHIPGSINIPGDELATEMAFLDKDKHYVVHCASYHCPLGKKCAKLLKEANFKVIEYPGGIVEWFQRGYPVKGPAQLDYLREENNPIHDEDNSIETITAEDLRSQLELK